MSRTTTRNLFTALALGGLALTAARADEAADSKKISPEQARCQAMGEGFYAIKGASSCVRISGYISAGVGFVSSTRQAAFEPHGGVFAEQRAGVALEQRFDTELGPGRIYVEVNGRQVDR